MFRCPTQYFGSMQAWMHRRATSSGHGEIEFLSEDKSKLGVTCIDNRPYIMAGLDDLIDAGGKYISTQAKIA